MLTQTTITSQTDGTGVTRDDLKLFARIPTITGEESLLDTFLSSARSFVTSMTGKVFDTSLTVEVVVDSFDKDEVDVNGKQVIELPIVGGTITVTEVVKYSAAGAETTLDYVLVSDKVVAYVNEGETVKISYTVTETELPEPIKHAIVLKAAAFYDSRMEQYTPALNSLLAPYSRRSFMG